MNNIPEYAHPPPSSPQPGAQHASEADAVRRRHIARRVPLDRALEALPLFRLGDSSEEPTLTFSPAGGGRWRVLPYPGDRIPGTFDQDVYVEIFRRFHDAGAPADGAVSFTLHSFLRSMGRRADGRTYAQLRAALARLEHTLLESAGSYYDAGRGSFLHGSFTLLTSVSIERRRVLDRTQFSLFASMATAEPGVARVVLSPLVRANLAAGHTITISISRYASLPSPVARRLYRLLELARSEDAPLWRVPVRDLAQMLPLAQRYPSHLLRVLHPAHEMLIAAGLLQDATPVQEIGGWVLEYALRTPD